jgi:hypothetical protein
VTRNGVRIVPDESPPRSEPAQQLASAVNQPPAMALDNALQDIAARYGARTRDVVAMQLEYPQQPALP